MKNVTRIYLAGLCALTLLAASCGNNDGTLVKPEDPNGGKFTYSVNGLKDTSLERIGKVRYPIFIEKKSGKTEYVVLSTSELPAGMTITFDPSGADSASFNTTIVVETKRTPVGDYSINVRGASATSGISNNVVNVKVLPYTNAAVGVAGDYTETGNCSQKGSVNNHIKVEVDAQTKNRVLISGLLSGVMTTTVYADIDPNNNTFKIPSQSANSVTYAGEGSFDDNKLIINYTVKGAVINESCTSTLNRN